jgi:hypothetical protein
MTVLARIHFTVTATALQIGSLAIGQVGFESHEARARRRTSRMTEAA